MEKQYCDVIPQSNSEPLAAETSWVDGHPMAWAPDDFTLADGTVSPSYIIDIGEEGVAEVEEALEVFHGERPRPQELISLGCI